MNTPNETEVAGTTPGPGLADPEVAVIIPAYRSLQYLGACIESVESQEEVKAKIIVSDNGSDDGSVEFIRDNHPGVSVIENNANLGFSGAVNRGLKEARDAPFIALVNPDAQTLPHCLANLAKALAATPEAGIAAARMMNAHNPECIDCMGVAVTSAFGQISIGSGRSSLPGFHKQRFVPAACGGGMMIKREVIEAAGAFDEDYFLCWEDIEFSFRAYRCGFRCVYVPDAVMLHASTAIMGHWSAINVFNYCRGALPTAAKLLPLRRLAPLLPGILMNRIKIAVLYAGGGRLGSAVKGDISGLKLAFKAFRKRGSLPGRKPGFELISLLKEGDRLRKVMKYGELFPSEQDEEPSV